MTSCVSCTDMILILFSSPQDGWSSLMFASQKGHNELVNILISASAKVDLHNLVSITSSSQGPMVTCALHNVMLYSGLEGYVPTIVVEIMGGVYTCVDL